MQTRYFEGPSQGKSFLKYPLTVRRIKAVLCCVLYAACSNTVSTVVTI